MECVGEMETPIILIQGGPSQQTGAGLVQSHGGDLRGVASPRVQLSMFLSAVREGSPPKRLRPLLNRLQQRYIQTKLVHRLVAAGFLVARFTSFDTFHR